MKSNRFICLILLCWLSSLNYAQTALSLYQQALTVEHSDYMVADSLVQLSIQAAANETDTTLLIKSYYLAARIQTNEGWFANAEHYFLKAIHLTNQTNLIRLKAEYCFLIGYCYLDQGKFNAAVKYALKSVQLAEEIDNDTIKAHALGSLAEIYRQYDKYELALQYNKMIIPIARRLNNENILAKTYNNLSATLGEMGNNHEAIDSLQKGLSLVSPSNDFSRAKFNSNIGYCYQNMGMYDKAIFFHRTALFFKRKTNMHKSIGYSLGAIGRAYLGNNEVDSALFYIKQEYDLAMHYKIPSEIKDAAIHLSKAYEIAGDYEKALQFFKENSLIEDSIYKAEVEINTLRFQRKFDLSHKQKEVDLLKHKQKLEETKSLIFLAILIALGIISILLALLYRARIKRKEEERKRVEIELNNSKLTIEQDKIELRAFTRELMLKNKSIHQLTYQLKEKNNQLNAIKESKSAELEQLIELRILTESDWKKFKLLFEKVYPSFFLNIKRFNLRFTNGEKRLMALIKLDMTNSEAADTLGISTESVSKSKFRLKKKLESHNLLKTVEEFVSNL